MSQTTESVYTRKGVDVDDAKEPVNATELDVTNENDANQQVWRPIQSNILTLDNIDICGIDMSDNGRQCSRHLCCGNYVKEGDILLLKTVTEHLIIDGVPDDRMRTMVKAYKINKQGIRSCHIGYVPEINFWQVAQEAFDGKFVQVNIDYRCSPYDVDRHMSYKKHGLLRGRIIYHDDNLYGYDYTSENPCDVSNYYCDIAVDAEEDNSHLSDYISAIPNKKKKRVAKEKPSKNKNISKQALKQKVKPSGLSVNMQPPKKQRNKTNTTNDNIVHNCEKFNIGTMVTIQDHSGTRLNGQVIKYTGYGTAYLISLSNQELIELTQWEMEKAVEAYTRPNSNVESVIIPMDYSTPADTIAEHSVVSSVTNEEQFY